MRFPFARYALVLTLLLGMAAVVPARAHGQTPAADGRASASAPGTPSPSPPLPSDLTAKERLGAKWMDEQRVNNCKVPVDKRGPKPRPDTCTTGRPR